jgi:hypothetical protein
VTVLCEVFAKESDDEGDGGHEEGHGHASWAITVVRAEKKKSMLFFCINSSCVTSSAIAHLPKKHTA